MKKKSTILYNKPRFINNIKSKAKKSIHKQSPPFPSHYELLNYLTSLAYFQRKYFTVLGLGGEDRVPSLQRI